MTFDDQTELAIFSLAYKGYSVQAIAQMTGVRKPNVMKALGYSGRAESWAPGERYAAYLRMKKDRELNSEQSKPI